MSRRLARRHVAAVLVAAALAAAGTVVASSTRSDVRAGASGGRIDDGGESPALRLKQVITSAAPTTAGTPRTTAHGPAPAPSCPWLDSSLPVATRVDELLRAMTPLEEATLLHLHQFNPSIGYEGYTPALARVCVPLITEQDGAAGVATGMTSVTQLPAPIADAAAFDPSLAGRYGDVIGAEDATKGVDLALSPTINIDRSPLWGRAYESLGEDPFLTASLAVPLIDGIQGHRVVSVVKHYAVYNQETHRATLADDAIVSEQALHEVYLPAFLAAVREAHAGAMMCSYNLVNGVPACEDVGLIDGILRQQWGFAGFVRSDCGSIFNEAPAMAVDVSQVKCTRFYNPAALADAVTSGRMPRAALDALARPLLTVLFEYNLIARPHPADRTAIASSPAHQQVARLTADEGAVLLKDKGHVLPLDFTHLSSLALIGPDGGTPMPAGFGAMHVLPSHPVSALSALEAALGTRVRYATGTDLAAAADIARSSQVAVVVVHDLEQERYDRTSLSLPGQQDALVETVARANPRTVVVLETGSAVLMPWLPAVDAVLETWYPGEEAGVALVDLLSGQVDPAGKLPVTFPADLTRTPAPPGPSFGGVGGRTLYSEGTDVGYRWYLAHDVAPAFRFGFGLSYTTFRLSSLRVTSAAASLHVAVTVTNTGRVRGADVVQVYVRPPAATGDDAPQLRGYQRVDLLPGRSQVVAMTLTPDDLASWSTAAHHWSVVGGTYTVDAGDGTTPAIWTLATSARVAPADLGAVAEL